MQLIPEERRALTAAKQLLHLRNNPLCAGAGVLGPNALEWTFPATPSPLGRDYTAQLSFSEGKPAQVIVVAPDLVALAEGKPLPHVYSENPVRLCLFLPRTLEWQPWMRFDETLVPWTTLWLYFFEDWLATGEWHGGGMHPGDEPVNRAQRRMRRHVLAGGGAPPRNFGRHEREYR